MSNPNTDAAALATLTVFLICLGVGLTASALAACGRVLEWLIPDVEIGL